MRQYGGYIPLTNTRVGDRELAERAYILWFRQFPWETPDPEDGVFVRRMSDGTLRTKIICKGSLHDEVPPPPGRVSLPCRELIRSSLMQVRVTQGV